MRGSTQADLENEIEDLERKLALLKGKQDAKEGLGSEKSKFNPKNSSGQSYPTFKEEGGKRYADGIFSAWAATEGDAFLLLWNTSTDELTELADKLHPSKQERPEGFYGSWDAHLKMFLMTCFKECRHGYRILHADAHLSGLQQWRSLA